MKHVYGEHGRRYCDGKIACRRDIPLPRFLTGMQLGVCPACAQYSIALGRLYQDAQRHDQQAMAGTLYEIFGYLLERMEDEESCERE